MSLKQKNIALVIGLLIVFFICYKIPIKQTLNAKKQYKELKLEQQLFANVAQQLVSLKAEQVYLDSILTKNQFATDKSFQSNLLYAITAFANKNKLTVVSFEEPHYFKKGDATLTTFSFSVRGGFNNSLKLLHELEQLKKLGKIQSIDFEKKKNYRTNKNYLETSFLLQRMEN
ncbi:MAG: hypothetical protein COB73_07765 [Flavobacteriaceae bacterium]|nr:MAG: hypothetical protein COB73_07765 [Flavobacteriaceae bacterium]